jgi:hypothetical protein
VGWVRRPGSRWGDQVKINRTRGGQWGPLQRKFDCGRGQLGGAFRCGESKNVYWGVVSSYRSLGVRWAQ